MKALHGQGTGRFEYSQMLARAERDLDALETVLTSRQFMFGEKPSAADASVGAMLATMQANQDETALRQAVMVRPGCVRYLQDVRQAIFPG